MRQRQRLHGLSVSRRSPGINWQLDCDYASKLSPKEAEFLSNFNDEFYMSASTRGIQSQEQLRERWRSYKSNQNDVLTYHQAIGEVLDVDEVMPGGHGEDGMLASLDAVRSSRLLADVPWRGRVQMPRQAKQLWLSGLQKFRSRASRRRSRRRIRRVMVTRADREQTLWLFAMTGTAAGELRAFLEA